MNNIMDILSSNTSGATQPTPSFIMAQVVENNDKKNAGMVKVEFISWQQGANISKWIPVMLPYAGKDYGSYQMPEIDDYVVVSFLGSSLDKPFVVGSLYPPDSSFVKDNFDSNNEVVSYKTKGGVLIEMQNKDGEQSVTVLTPKESKICISDKENSIDITDKDGKNHIVIKLEDGDILVESENKISLKTGKCGLAMDGKSGEIKVECDKFTVDATQNVTMTSTNVMKLEAGTGTMEGKQQLALQSSGVCEIKGNMVKIN